MGAPNAGYVRACTMDPLSHRVVALAVVSGLGSGGLRYLRGMQWYLETTTPDISGGRLLH